ncbi:MAG: glutamyl-tRNA reductase [Paraperlucidibaca sp.]
MTLLAFGINHKTASVALRERAAFAPEALGQALRDARQHAGLDEVAILSTCNRTEFYGAADPQRMAAVRQWLAASRGINEAELEAVWYVHEGDEALRHAMRVASGLDSMVLGEPQIFGQMKTAWSEAVAAGTAGSALDKFFQVTFAATKAVRSKTALGASPVSIGFAAVTLARQVFESLAQTPTLLVGAGEMNGLVAKHLREHGVAELMIVNRTLARAEVVAQQVEAEAMPWSCLPDALARAGVVISCTGSNEPVITQAMVKQALKARRHQPMLLIDIAVPRDIEPSVAELDDVFLYTVDDLQSVIDTGWRNRQAAAIDAERLIDRHVQQFVEQQRVAEAAVALIRQVRGQASSVADAERLKALSQLRQGADPEVVLARLQHNLINKWLHAPTVNLRQLAASNDAEGLLLVAQALGVKAEDNPVNSTLNQVEIQAADKLSAPSFNVSETP